MFFVGLIVGILIGTVLLYLWLDSDKEEELQKVREQVQAEMERDQQTRIQSAVEEVQSPLKQEIASLEEEIVNLKSQLVHLQNENTLREVPASQPVATPVTMAEESISSSDSPSEQELTVSQELTPSSDIASQEEVTPSSDSPSLNEPTESTYTEEKTFIQANSLEEEQLSASNAEVELSTGLQSSDISISESSKTPLQEEKEKEEPTFLEPLISNHPVELTSQQETDMAVDFTGFLTTLSSLKELETDSFSKDVTVRKQTVLNLGEWVDRQGIRNTTDQAISLLEKLSRDQDETVRQSAVQVLGTIPSAKVIPALLQAKRDTDPTVVFLASNALQRYQGYTLPSEAGQKVNKPKNAQPVDPEIQL